MSLRRLFDRTLRAAAPRWLLAVLLLLAQQGALTHALVHAGAQAHGGHIHAAQVDDGGAHALHGDHGGHDDHGADGQSAASAQCAFDLVYSQVLGALHSTALPLCAETAAPVTAVVAQAPVGAAPEVPYDSRGPPAFS